MDASTELLSETYEPIDDAQSRYFQQNSAIEIDFQCDMSETTEDTPQTSRSLSDVAQVQETKKVKKWTVHPGRNRFCVGGRLVCSKSQGAFFLTVFIMLSTISLFFIFDAPYIWVHINPSIPIVAAVLSLFVISNFFVTALSDPGIIPRVGNLEVIETDKQNAETVAARQIADESSGSAPQQRPRSKEIVINGERLRVKYCPTCRMWRPPRAIHCSTCDNCVLMFDHHCPWVGNCIGLRNYSYFYRFVISLSILIVFFFSVSISHICLIARTIPLADAVRETPMSVVVAVVCFFAIWSVIGLSFFHTYLLVTNQTTNEDLKGTFRKKNRTAEHIVKNPFHTGCLKNIAFRLFKSPSPSLLDATGYVNDNIFVVVPKHFEKFDQHPSQA